VKFPPTLTWLISITEEQQARNKKSRYKNRHTIVLSVFFHLQFLKSVIVQDPEIHSGEPVFPSTRVSFQTLLLRERLYEITGLGLSM